MDILNNIFGKRHAAADDLRTCEVIRKEVSGNAIFIGEKVDPWKWAKRVDYRYHRAGYRKLRNTDNSQPVYPSGAHCDEIRVGIGSITVNPLVPPWDTVVFGR